MAKVLTAWLPLLAGVLLLLGGSAYLLARKPRTGLGELKSLERALHSRRMAAKLVVGVFVSTTAILYLMTIMLELRLPLVIAYVTLAVGAIFFLAFLVFSIARLFDSTRKRLLAGIFPLAVGAAWLVWPNWITVDLVAIMLVICCLSVYLQLTLNFRGVALVVGALFLYDIVNVYITKRMLVLAAQVLGPPGAENERPLPMMIIVPRNWSPDATPAAALGLGDIVFPGLLIMIGAVLAYRHHRPTIIYWGLGGYTAGMIAVFAILYFARVGQPALLTLYPAVLIGVLVGAKRAGLLKEPFALRHPSLRRTESSTPNG
ncbi:MAG TPA: presenilin family intramembrane aspartyl protease [Candidatus Saccharimonadales bacterium]|nr:presenilin family intramembrane aspartyl protease [Candidatus Saccharimonadales bacterium]